MYQIFSGNYCEAIGVRFKNCLLYMFIYDTNGAVLLLKWVSDSFQFESNMIVATGFRDSESHGIFFSVRKTIGIRKILLFELEFFIAHSFN